MPKPATQIALRHLACDWGRGLICAVAVIPAARTTPPGTSSSSRRTGRRWTTLTQLPVAFSGGRTAIEIEERKIKVAEPRESYVAEIAAIHGDEATEWCDMRNRSGNSVKPANGGVDGALLQRIDQRQFRLPDASCPRLLTTSEFAHAVYEAGHMVEASRGTQINCRITLVPDGVRFTAKPWSGKDVLKLARAAVAEQ
jgi:hypothetical protein